MAFVSAISVTVSPVRASYVHCCLPRRLRQPVEHAHARVCSQCQTPVPGTVLALFQSMACRCTQATRPSCIHLYVLLFCSAPCSDAFHYALSYEGYDDYLVFVNQNPGAASTHGAIIAAIHTALAEKTGTYTDEGCAHCTARRWTGTVPGLVDLGDPSKSRGYCSKECNRDHDACAVPCAAVLQ